MRSTPCWTGAACAAASPCGGRWPSRPWSRRCSPSASAATSCRSFGTKQIARVAIEGTITEDRDQLELLKRIADADNAAALLVFVNSPGGTTTGGEALFAALREVAKKKPVVAQFGTVAASAGYIVGLGTDHIVTRANTITGSVGVLIQWPEVSQALDKLGVKFNEIKSGDLKAVPSPFEPLSEEGPKVTQTMIDEGYPLVPRPRRAAPRHQGRSRSPGLTRGRVFTGREAVQLKLVDSIGGEDEAVEWLRSTRNIDKSLKVVDWKPQTIGLAWAFSALSALPQRAFSTTPTWAKCWPATPPCRVSALTGSFPFGTLRKSNRLQSFAAGRAMIKSELIHKIANTNPHLYHRDVERIVKVVFDEIVEALSRGDRVELRGFGAFTVKHRAARQGRNPRTGKSVSVAEKFVPFFKTGKELRDRLNRGKESH